MRGNTALLYIDLIILHAMVRSTAASGCSPLPTVLNGNVTSEGRSLGTVAYVTCDAWYHKVTHRPLECVGHSVSNPAIGRWVGDVKCVG